MSSERPPSPRNPPLSCSGNALTRATLRRPARCSLGSRPSVSGVMDDAGYPELLPFPLFINLDQHNRQCVSWHIIPLVAH
jgi:hypothetical protein